MIFPISVYANDNINDESITEEKIYYQGTLDDDFNDDKIIVVLSKEETSKYKDYSLDDFPEIDCESVSDLTQSIVNKIKSKGFDENKSLINLEKFNRILSLELKEKSKENVLKSIKKLEKRREILSAEPNTTIDMCNAPNDEKISEQWDLTNTNVYNAWNVSQNASQVLVGVVDSGIDSTHKDLKNHVYKAEMHNIDTTLHRDFTNGSKSVDIYALETDILSTKPNNKYEDMGGTSMATPFVTGAAALLLLANNNLSTLELKEAIINGADTISIMVPAPGCEGNQKTNVLKLNIENTIKRVAYKVDSSGEKIIGA